MTKNRLEAFSDGVIAIIITIMVLELKIPHESELIALKPLIPKIISYLISFVFVGTYWNNHHHMLHAAKQVNGNILWANLNLLFWLSLIPFVTGWMGENNFSEWPVALYGFILLMAAIGYYLLTLSLAKKHGLDSPFARAIGSDYKGKISLITYLTAIPLSFINEWLSLGLYLIVQVIWFIPDPRFEKALKD
jgi:uncharacterized membrane protein